MKIISASFILGFSGALYEYYIANTISNILGNTYQHYILSFSIFIFGLGTGSYICQTFPRLKSKPFFILVQFILTVFALLLPVYFEKSFALIHSFNPIISLALAYLPALLIGTLTGTELPILFLFDSSRPVAILAADFLGMALGIFTLPLLLFLEQSLHKLLPLLSLLHLLVISIIYRHKNSYSNLQTNPDSRRYKKSQMSPLIYSLALIFSFLSYGYESLSVKILHNIVPSTWIIILGVSVFILGMGLSSFTIHLLQKEITWIHLVIVEILMSFIVIVSPSILMSLATKMIDLKIGFPLLVLALPFVLGALTGFELPFLYVIFKIHGSDAPAIWLLIANYLGSLSAGLIFGTGALLKLFTWETQFLLLSLANILIATLLLLGFKNLRPKSIFVLILYGLLSFHAPTQYDRFLNNFLGLIYNRPNGFVKRTYSIYQTIDEIFPNPLSSDPAQSQLFSLFLDQKPQLQIPGQKIYHESFFFGGLALASLTPKEILILGGGDGLLAAIVLEHLPSSNITLVELDEEMIKVATTNPFLKKANNLSLKKIHSLRIQDAFEFLLSNHTSFDAIFVDFPYPANLELHRLYSKEFYQHLSNNLKPNGFVVINAPLHRSQSNDQQALVEAKRRLKTIFCTLRSAGFKTIYPYGLIEPFIFLQFDDNKKPSFDYSKVPLKIELGSFMNLYPIDLLGVESETCSLSWVNSLWSPKWIGD